MLKSQLEDSAYHRKLLNFVNVLFASIINSDVDRLLENFIAILVIVAMNFKDLNSLDKITIKMQKK